MEQLTLMPIDQVLETDSPFNRLYHGACESILPTLPDACVDLIVTSPPYADQRKHTHGGIPPDEYVERFLPIAAQLWRVLKPTGSFILNIKERVVNGERHTYVLELILALRKQRKFAMYQEAVMLPVGDWADDQRRKLSETDRRRDKSRVQSGFGKNISNWVGRQLAYPTNVLHIHGIFCQASLS